MGRDSSVGIATGWTAGARDFSLFYSVQTCSGTQPAGTLALFVRDVKLTAHLHLVPPSKTLSA
jgi:hypothetical protein